MCHKSTGATRTSPVANKSTTTIKLSEITTASLCLIARLARITNHLAQRGSVLVAQQYSAAASTVVENKIIQSKRATNHLL
jgi:hypothetical protein